MSEEIIVNFKKGYEQHPRTKETLGETNDLTIGQVFHGVAKFYDKEPSDYPRWISYEKNYNEFLVVKAAIESCSNDLEKVHMVCEWLGEDVI